MRIGACDDDDDEDGDEDNDGKVACNGHHTTSFAVSLWSVTCDKSLVSFGKVLEYCGRYCL